MRNIYLAFILIGLSVNAAAKNKRKFTYVLANSTLLEEFDPNDLASYEGKGNRRAERIKARRDARKKTDCEIGYKGTPISIEEEINLNLVRISIAAGHCKGTAGMVKASDIMVQHLN